MMPSQSMNEAANQILRQHVTCALCGADDSRIKYTIDTRNIRFSSLWVNGVEHKLETQETIVECRRCGLAYVNPRLSADAAYAPCTTAMELAYFAQTSMERRQAYSRLLDKISSWLGRPPATLLDIGCGDGLLVDLARRRGIHSAGAETSKQLVQLVRNQLGADAIVEEQLDNLPSAHYDVITLINVIEHLQVPQDILRAGARLLKPGGILLVHTPNWGGLPARLDGPRWHQIEPFSHFYYFTGRTLGKMLRQSGFTPFDRFHLIVASGIKARLQELLGGIGIYIDNGLGIVARYGDGRIVGR
jgi:2-polyprenyl-3-methyl-5-hydroxy-6-metoxy-1,4-benzoquinol methylase